jgi:3-phenylpropionate/trans-cinnamate dioxygenase ferredoxin reductase subunit
MENHILIIGAGQAGGELALQLRRKGHAGPITLVGDEPHLPYQRPPLSKAFLTGAIGADALTHASRASLDKAEVRFLSGRRATGIDPAGHTVSLDDGSVLSYAKLALATGGTPRRLPLPHADLQNVFTLRSIADSDALRPHLLPGRRLLVVGGGYIGLEVAAVATKQGLAVTVLEAGPRILGRSAGPEIADFLSDYHRRQGVELLCGTLPQALEADGGRVVAARCGDGTRHAADLVLVGIGLVPAVGLAQMAGLRVEGGIVVDEYTQTSDPDIVALGDCTSHRNLSIDGLVRLESVQNALDQARVAAGTLLGRPEPYDAIPWFWSDQYDIKLQMVGLCNPEDDRIVRGSPADGAFSVFHLRGGRIAAVHCVNRPADFMAGKKLVAGRITATAEQLADTGLPLKLLFQPG